MRKQILWLAAVVLLVLIGCNPIDTVTLKDGICTVTSGTIIAKCYIDDVAIGTRRSRLDLIYVGNHSYKAVLILTQEMYDELLEFRKTPNKNYAKLERKPVNPVGLYTLLSIIAASIIALIINIKIKIYEERKTQRKIDLNNDPDYKSALKSLSKVAVK